LTTRSSLSALLLALLLAVTGCTRRDALFRAGFEGRRALDAWSGDAGRLEPGYRGTTSLLVEQGWDWPYHAFREWAGWSVEHTTDPQDWNPSPTPTDRERLLRKWFGQNVRPEPKGKP